MLDADSLQSNRIKIDGKWRIARPIRRMFRLRLRDAIQVLTGRAEAVKFYKQ